MMHVYMYDIELYNQPTPITNSFIEESSAEDEGRKQEHLHSWGPGLNKQCITGQNGTSVL